MKDELLTRIARAEMEITICRELLAGYQEEVARRGGRPLGSTNGALRKLILGALSREWQSVTQVAERIGRKRQNIYGLLRDFAAAGEIEIREVVNTDRRIGFEYRLKGAAA